MRDEILHFIGSMTWHHDMENPYMNQPIFARGIWGALPLALGAMNHTYFNELFDCWDYFQPSHMQ